MSQKKIIILNGPNLNLLGKREPEIYGTLTFEDYYVQLQEKYNNVHLLYFQTNHEGAMLDILHQYGFTVDGFVINAGAYTHTSIALADAIKGISTPCVEVHISDVYEREEFRHISYMKQNCVLSIVGKGLFGYDEAIDYLLGS